MQASLGLFEDVSTVEPIWVDPFSMQTLIFSFQYASNLVINSVNHFSLQTLIGPFEDLSNVVTDCCMDLCQLRAICDFQ